MQSVRSWNSYAKYAWLTVAPSPQSNHSPDWHRNRAQRVACAFASILWRPATRDLAPEVLEARRRQLGIPHRVLDILVTEVILQRAGIVTGVR